MVSRTSSGRIANTLAGSTPGLIVPIARIFVVGVDVVMGCAYPEFKPERLKISIRPAERACFIYVLHNIWRPVAQWLRQLPGTDLEVLLSASKFTEPGEMQVGPWGKRGRLKSDVFSRICDVGRRNREGLVVVPYSRTMRCATFTRPRRIVA